MAFNIVLYAYAIIGHTRANQLLPQLLMEQFDTFPIQCRHISLIRCLYMHRQCLYGPINFYHSFLWSNLILCLYNVDTFNICIKEFGLEKIIFDKMTALRT